MSAQIIGSIITAISGLIGAIIGFLGCCYTINKQTNIEKNRVLLERRRVLYERMLRFIQDYQTSKTNGKKIAIPADDIHQQLYNLLPEIYVYASEDVKNTFEQCKKNIGKGIKNNDFTKLANTIRDDLNNTKLG